MATFSPVKHTGSEGEDVLQHNFLRSMYINYTNRVFKIARFPWLSLFMKSNIALMLTRLRVENIPHFNYSATTSVIFLNPCAQVWKISMSFFVIPFAQIGKSHTLAQTLPRISMIFFRHFNFPCSSLYSLYSLYDLYTKSDNLNVFKISAIFFMPTRNGRFQAGYWTVIEIIITN